MQAADVSPDYLHAVSVRERTMMPVNFQHVESFNRSELCVDFTSLVYLESCQDDVQSDHQPILTTGDGNCLFNALSISVCGTESLSEEIRVRTCIEMVLNKGYYLSLECAKNLLLCSPPFDESCKQCATPGGYSSSWTIQAAADAIHRDIYSVYPKMNGKLDQTAKILTRVHSTRHLQDDLSPVSIMWTKMGPHFGRIWLPNHFVPLISVSSDNDVESAQNEFNSDYVFH